MTASSLDAEQAQPRSHLQLYLLLGALIASGQRKPEVGADDSRTRFAGQFDYDPAANDRPAPPPGAGPRGGGQGGGGQQGGARPQSGG